MFASVLPVASTKKFPYADDEKAALAYNKAVSDAGLAGVRELNRVDASGRPVPKSRAAQFTVTIHGGRD